MLGIGDVGYDLSAVLDAIAGGVVGVIEWSGPQTNTRMRHQSLARGKIDELDLSGKDPHRDREQWRDHHVVEHRLDAHAVQMTGPDPDFALRIVTRSKKRQPADMVEMRVAVEQVEV